MSNWRSLSVVLSRRLLSLSLFLSLFLSLALSLTLSLSLTAALAQTNKTLVIRPDSGPLAGQTVYTNSYAVIIGVDDYANLPKDKHLDFAVKDATDLRETLVRSYSFPAENVTMLLDNQATRANIEAALAALSSDRVKAGDRILIYFSGHGQTVTLQDGGEMGFLIPYDAKVDLANPRDRSGYLGTCLRMDNIWGYLEASAAKHRLLIADSCFGGLLIKGKALTNERPNSAVIASLLARPALQAMTAGGANEEALEDPSLGHSAYTFKLLEELKAQAATPDNVFLASQLAGSLKTSVANLTNSKQTPQFGNHNATEGDFVFVTTKGRPVPPLVPIRRDPPINADPERPVVPAGNGGVGLKARTKINPKDGAIMIFIAAGEFLMGDDDRTDNPRHKVMLSGYWIYKDLVTVGMYKKYCQETGKQMPPEPESFAGNKLNPGWGKEDHPIVDVSWNDAVAYCAWAGVSLPSEAQWEKAARGTDGLKYPWGNEFDLNKVWASKAAVGDAGGTAAVGKYGVHPYGCTDMAGNVWQWCADWYDAGFWSSRLAEAADPVNQSVGEQKMRVMRGGSWGFIEADYFRASFRNRSLPDYGNNFDGFRCAAGL